MKRRESMVGNHFIRTNNQSSPFNSKNVMVENTVKNNMGMQTNVQHQKSNEQIQKNIPVNKMNNMSYINVNNGMT